MKRIILVSVQISVLFIVWTAARAQDDAPQTIPRGSEAIRSSATTADSPDGQEQKPSHWMERKMRLSKAAFEGIAKGDFDQIRSSARDMKVLSRAEHFVRSKPESYRIQLKLFRFANDELMKSAQSKNIESATLAFNQLTVSCVNCHKIIRAAN